MCDGRVWDGDPGVSGAVRMATTTGTTISRMITPSIPLSQSLGEKEREGG